MAQNIIAKEEEMALWTVHDVIGNVKIGLTFNHKNQCRIVENSLGVFLPQLPIGVGAVKMPVSSQ